MKNILYTIILSFLFSFSVFADFEAGMDAINRGDYKTALKEWKPLAEQGNAAAQNNLARLYQGLFPCCGKPGRGVRPDSKKAEKWFRLAAEQGDADSQFNLGVMYAAGKHVEKDNKEAVKWYRLAAENGYAGAQNNLGVMYQNGEGVFQDNKEAVKWYRLAAEQGFARAQINLGVMYGSGSGVTPSYVLAHMWFNIAVSNKKSHKNEGLAYNSIQRMKEVRALAESMMTPEQIAKAKVLARECIAKNYKNCDQKKEEISSSKIDKSKEQEVPEPKIDKLKEKCQNIGFKPNTDEFKNCVLELML